ncbi:MAG TPA: hypothetical protein PKC18_12435 [Lacipirellulaceae bacterium]|nr:hypothetical protein [Lacipirellulaceae bacterium]
MLNVLSLGAGVQSTALLLMSIRGELDQLDCAIFADTGWEPQAVYAHLAWLESEAAAAGVPVYRVRRGDLRADALRSQIRGRKIDGVRWASMPLYVLGEDGGTGMIRRQCTSEYKIVPVERKIRDLLGLKPRQRWPVEVVVNQFFGISADEQRRVRIPKELWKRHRYPFVLERPMRREQIVDWLQVNYPGRRVPRSACLGCPFHSDEEWRAIKANPDEWADVTAFDNAIRHCGGMRGDVFLHRSCRPLESVDLRPCDERAQQLQLWDGECFGMCGT